MWVQKSIWICIVHRLYFKLIATKVSLIRVGPIRSWQVRLSPRFRQFFVSALSLAEQNSLSVSLWGMVWNLLVSIVKDSLIGLLYARTGEWSKWSDCRILFFLHQVLSMMSQFILSLRIQTTCCSLLSEWIVWRLLPIQERDGFFSVIERLNVFLIFIVHRWFVSVLFKELILLSLQHKRQCLYRVVVL
jgi:hypothetical protein